MEGGVVVVQLSHSAQFDAFPVLQEDLKKHTQRKYTNNELHSYIYIDVQQSNHSTYHATLQMYLYRYILSG